MNELMKKVELKKQSNLNQIKSSLFYGLWNVVIEGNKFQKGWKRNLNKLTPKQINELVDYEAI